MMGHKKVFTHFEAEEALASELNEGLYVVVELDDGGRVLETYLVKADNLSAAVSAIGTGSMNTEIIYVNRYGRTVPKRFTYMPAEASYWRLDEDD